MFGKFLTDDMIKKYMSLWIIAILLLSNIVITPVSATTIAAQVFSKNFDGVRIRWVDTNSLGTMTFVGLDNGSVVGMYNNGTIRYNVLTGNGIKKIVSSDEGDIVWSNDNADVGYIFRDGTQNVTWIYTGSANTSGIAIAHNGSFFQKIWNGTTVSKTRIYDTAGGTLYSYDTPTGPPEMWNNLQLDDKNSLFVITNFTNSKMTLYGIANYTGWINFNPTKGAVNTTLLYLDNFAYRANLTINNGATSDISIGFTRTTNPAIETISRVSNAEYLYNVTNCGKYFLWTNGNNISYSPQSLYLNWSYYNETSKIYNVTFNKSSLIKNMTFYFGGPTASTFTNKIVNNNWTINNGTLFIVNVTGSGTWTVPNNVTAVNLTMYGGGGGGSFGPWSYGEQPGQGGNASTKTSYGNIKVTPGSSCTVSVGTGGYSTSLSYGPYYLYHAAGSSIFNNGSTDYTASGAAQGSGAGISGKEDGLTGNTTTPGYPTGTDGSLARSTSSCAYGCHDVTNVGTGGLGYGAGGGGGAGTFGICSCEKPGLGGSGTNGIIYISYYVNDIPKYFMGTAPQTGANTFIGPYNSTTMNETISSSIKIIQNKTLVGNITSISIPESGGIITAGTGTPSGTGGKVYAVEINSAGFSTEYSANAQTGVSNMIVSSDGATYYIEARASQADIYQLDGTLAGQYYTGGIVNSVDMAVKNGLWAVAGGNDGILYIFSKATSSSWAVYYQGDASASITSVAMSDLGTYVAVGRSDGTFEYYSTQEDATSDYIFSANLFVNKGGVPYSGQSISIGELSSSAPYALIQNYTGITDTSGKYTFNAYNGRMYDIYVGAEFHQVYTGSSSYPTISINIPVAVITRPYQYASTFNTTNKIITSTYNDVNAADVNIKVIDVQSKAIVSSRDYIGATTITDVVNVPYDNRSYKTVFNFTRTTGAQYSDTVYLQSSIFNRIPQNTSDQNTLFIYAVYTVMLMVISLGIGMASTKYGVVFLVALTFAGILFGFLPYSLYTAGIATSAFIALLEVYRRHD